ncbi:hypothetical protein JKP88DRAFT_227485 [Tribonema minus]|uniref:Steroid 5-alpha reductase C-terminal domain-containing protein n=1 Tax=Tribonema minus TaxID=303371 RepID=A0A835YJU7_9STRA|nr:hypothetical protein JKP88DRAFT_227485 [Tribonema minus]
MMDLVNAEPLQRSLVLSLIASAGGYGSFVWFVSYGYGLSMALQAGFDLAKLGLPARRPSFAQLHVLCVFLYGLRLTAFIAWRDTLASYKQRSGKPAMRKLPFLKKLGMSVPTHVLCAALYVLLYVPSIKLLEVGAKAGVGAAAKASLGLAYAALFLEALSDQQKSSFKKKHPDQLVTTGLFRVCRHPNYLFETLFWLGTWGAAATAGAFSTWQDWTMSSVGLALIWAIMAEAVTGLERKQEQKYAGPGYSDYRARVPCFVPFTKLGHKTA